MSTINPLDYEAIRNTLATYSLALDTKDWPLLRQVFTEDVDADYPFSGPIKGVDAVIEGIKNRLTPITSQHALTTQTIEIQEGGKTAKATTYFTGIHFGKGKWKGQQVTAWGKYEDELVLTGGKGIAGSSGHWLISKRVVGFMGRLGEEGVMTGEDS